MKIRVRDSIGDCLFVVETKAWFSLGWSWVARYSYLSGNTDEALAKAIATAEAIRDGLIVWEGETK